MSAPIVISLLFPRAARCLLAAAFLVAVMAVPAADQAWAKPRQVTLSWDYDSRAVPGLAGFRVYHNKKLLCETSEPAARQLACPAALVSAGDKFTMTAFDRNGNESAHAGAGDVSYQGADAAGDSAWISKAGWSIAFVDSEETVGENGAAKLAIDGDPVTFWHTQWYNYNPQPPHELAIDLGRVYAIEGFRCLPRPLTDSKGNGEENGRIKEYEFYVSMDGAAWRLVSSGIFANAGEAREVMFPKAIGRFVKLVALSEVNGNPWTSVAELDIRAGLAGAANMAPLADSARLTTTEDIAASGTLPAVDPNGENLRYTLVSDARLGSVVLTNSATGAYTYTPDPGVSGKDRFTFKVNNGALDSNVAIVDITILPADGSYTSDFGFEAGELLVDHNWQRVNFGRYFYDPVVVAPAASLNDAAPAVVRIRNVTNSGFEIRVQEWDYLDGIHAVEMVPYLVMEHGLHILPGGVRVEAGRFETSNVNPKVPEKIPFMNQIFHGSPVIMASIVSENEADAVAGRLTNVKPAGFGFFMQEQEANSLSHSQETVSYIAWEESAGMVAGLRYEVGMTGPKAVNHLPVFIPFGPGVQTSPVFLGNIQTANGLDPATLRWWGISQYGVRVFIAEEQSATAAVSHAREGIGFMLFY